MAKDSRFADWHSQLNKYAASGDHQAKTLSEALSTSLDANHPLCRLFAYSPYLSGLLNSRPDAGAYLLT
ncbi:MAG: hypothetical protein AAF213_01210, partial [Pseudomonadota bacterium]